MYDATPYVYSFPGAQHLEAGQLYPVIGMLRAGLLFRRVDASALSKLNCWRLLKLIKIKSARSRLYRRRFLQVNTRWKALAEIYTMHSFAPFWNPFAKTGEKGAWPKQPRKGRKQENERPLSSAQQAT